MEPAGGPGRVPRGPRGDRLLRPLAVQGRGRDRPASRRSTGSACAPPQRRRGRTTRSRSARTRARRRSTCSTPKRRTLIPRVERTLLALEGVDLVMRMGDHPDGEAIVRGERSRGVKELRFAPARRSRRRARARAGASRATSTCSALKIEDDQVRSATYPDAMGRVWSRAALPDGRRGAGLGRGRATSSSTGAARTTSAAAPTARCTPTTPTARCCGAGTGPEKPTRASSGRCATSRRWCSSTSA